MSSDVAIRVRRGVVLGSCVVAVGSALVGCAGARIAPAADAPCATVLAAATTPATPCEYVDAGAPPPPCGCAPCVEDACIPWRETSISIPIWIPGVTGSFAKGSTSVDVDRPDDGALSNGDRIATELEFALVGRVDSRWGRFLAFADVFGVKMKRTADFRVDDLDASGRLEAVVGRVLVGWRLLQPSPDPCSTTFTLDGYVGARICYANLRLDQPDALSFSAEKTWVDPVIAARAIVDFPGPFDVSAMADIGGFGVGSDLSWSVSIEARWHFARSWSLFVGWSWLSVDYDVGSSGDRFVLDVDVRGPVLGITFTF